MTTQSNTKGATQTNAKGNQTNAKGTQSTTGNAIGKPGNQENGAAKAVQSNSKEAVREAIAKRSLTLSDAVNINAGNLGESARGRKPLQIPVKALCEKLPACLELPLGRAGKPLKYTEEEMMTKIISKETNPHTGKPYTLSDLQESKTWHYATDSTCMYGKEWLDKEPEAVLSFTKGALTAAYASIAAAQWSEFQETFGDGEKDDEDGGK